MQISEQDKTIAAALVNPDNEHQEHFEHDFHISQQMLGLIICDRHFLVQSMDLVKPEYFQDDSHRLICSIVFNFYRKYKELPPKLILTQEITEARRDSEALLEYLAELEVILDDYVDGASSREYLMDKMVDFAKVQATKYGVGKTLDILKKKPTRVWDEIREVWRKAFLVDKGHDVGLDYFNTIDERYKRMDEEKNRKEIFTSGFPEGALGKGIDGLLAAGGLCRGEMGAFLGLSGSGKSIALINASAMNITWGKKVCYITLEMNQDKIARRFDSLLSEEPFRTLVDNRKMVAEAILQFVKHEEDKRRLQIKHYPGGTADVNTIRAYLSQLNLYSNFKPDLLVIDYLGEMKDAPGIPAWESQQLIARDLRALAVEENMCVLTAMQANRRGREVQDFGGSIDDDSIANSFGTVRPLDALWSINKLEGSNLGHIFIAKHRDGVSKQSIWYELNEQTLKLREISYQDWKEKRRQFDKRRANQVDDKMDKMEIQ